MSETKTKEKFLIQAAIMGTIEVEVTGTTLKDALESFKDQEKELVAEAKLSVSIDGVGDQCVVGWCECCELPIFDGEDSVAETDGDCSFHVRCLPED